jgi:uncharacterized protein
VKYLLLIAVVLAVVWYLRGGARQMRGPAQGEGRAAPPPMPQDMVECPVCRVHLPRADALPGPDGQLYCCAEHRAGAT